MEELEKVLKDQKRKQASVRQMLHRKNAKKDDEDAFKESQTRKKQSQRCAEIADDEDGFRHKLAREKRFQRSAERTDDEEGFRHKLAREKRF